ncbi:hypothetical protein [Devosia beringensis]|uniref:hypothetical protein n=1 Tax=Devosia beringensis TaxID=2657486 RepID=UPI00186B7B6E|nr:hypothetical protein [Devosia beringensis]
MRLALVAILSLAITPVLALEAVTYKGTLGKFDIIAELTDPASSTIVGRYSYMSKGGDIPLDAMESTGGSIALSEETPCAEETCIQNDDGVVVDPPIGATWTLQWSATDNTLTGAWQATGKAGKTLPIALKEIGRRTLPEGAELTPYDLYDSVFQLSYGGLSGFNAQSAPYDFAKMDVPLELGDTQAVEGSTIRFVTDPRTRFAFPRVVALADGSAPDAANRGLAARHAKISFRAFDCLAQIYAGFGANQYSIGMGPGTLGDYDSETIAVSYLSPTLMSWMESGSTWCGGAHPDNHSNSFSLDVRTGATLALAKVFKDWTATSRKTGNDDGAAIDQAAAADAPDDYYWSAGQKLIDYVIANRLPDPDADFEAECGIDELIATYLGARFVPGDRVLLTLEGLPNVVAACGGDLLTVRLADITELLAPTAGDYFPSLAR